MNLESKTCQEEIDRGNIEASHTQKISWNIKGTKRPGGAVERRKELRPFDLLHLFWRPHPHLDHPPLSSTTRPPLSSFPVLRPTHSLSHSLPLFLLSPSSCPPPLPLSGLPVWGGPCHFLCCGTNKLNNMIIWVYKCTHNVSQCPFTWIKDPSWLHSISILFDNHSFEYIFKIFLLFLLFLASMF